MQKFILLAAVLALALTGCSPKKIPGTDLDDTSETRAVIDVLQKYRDSFEESPFEDDEPL